MQRSLNHLKKRFEFALKTNKPIWINENDINALNELIEFANGKHKTNQLEDSLMLFYLLQHWKVANQNNKLTLEKRKELGIFECPDSVYILEKLTKLIHPKQHIAKMIYTEINCFQRLADQPKNEWISESRVNKFLDKLLDYAKNSYPITKKLHNSENVEYDYCLKPEK